MNITCVIPARGGSKGIPKKNIIDFAGKPLLAWTIEQAKAARHVSEVYVSSDSAEILAVAGQYGAKTIKRGPDISGDQASSESALLHALKQLAQQPDLVVFLQATSPLRKADDIDRAIDQFIKEGADSLLSLIPTQEFMWKTENGEFSPLTFDLNRRCGHRDLRTLYYENGSIYIFKPKILETYQNRLGGKISIYLMESWQRADIDDVETLDWCQFLFRKYLLKDGQEA